MKHLISLVTFSLICTSTFAQWQRVQGPYKGRTNALVRNASDIYSSFIGGEIYLSSDKGQKWLNIGQNLPKATVNTIAHDGKKLFAGTDSGIYTSNDNGKTWNSLNSIFDDQNINYIGIHDKIIIVGSYYNIYISKNGGQTWEVSNNGVNVVNGYMLTKTLIIDKFIFLALYGSGVYYTLDTGKQWSPAGNIGLGGYLVNDLISKNNQLYAGCAGGLFRCDLNDFIWTNIHLDFYEYYTLVFSENGDQMFCGTQAGVKVSNTNGMTWLSANTDIENTVIKKLMFVEGVLIAGADYDAIYTSQDNGYNWSHTSIGINSSFPFNLKSVDNKIFTNSNLSALDMSEDNGLSWQTIKVKNVSDRVYKIVEHKNKYCAISNSYNFHVSNDKGLTWNSVQLNYPASYLTDILSTGSYLYGINYIGILVRSSNDGNDWIQLLSGIENKQCYKIERFNNDLILSNGGGISISYDNGDTWITYSDSMSVQGSWSNKMAFLGTTIIVANSVQGISISKDSTRTWTSMNNGLNNPFINDLIVYEGIIYLATNEGVFYSADTAKSWIPVNENLKNKKTQQITALNGHLYIGTQGNGIWKRQIWETTKLEPISKINYKFYPNPANDLIYFESTEQALEIRIYDANGKALVILNKDLDDLSSGMDISDLTPGLYFFQVQTAKGLITEKFIVNE